MNAPAGISDVRISRPPVAGRRLGRYEILTQIASGGMASVYIARAQGVAGFERLVAIKVLHPHLAYEQEFISMFLDEARLAARIRHTNVVPTLDISDSPGDGYFLVMEYIEGDHFGALLGQAARSGDCLPRPFVFRVLVDALHGLSAAHQLADEDGKPLKLVHRDVSPHNILVGTDGIARLTDFGVAKADVRMASTRAGQFKGKLSYMAPEQASTSETDQRSDLFSVGIILWESLTGRRLFKGETNAATLNKLLNESVLKPSAFGTDLEPFDAVVMKALSRNPEHRFQTADEFGEAIDDAAGRTGISKTRDVAEVVRSLNAEKLRDERSRLREAIGLLGKAEPIGSKVPMPREGSSPPDPAGSENDNRLSTATGSVSGVLSDGAPAAVRRSSSADSLKWVVMLLAIVVFLYAGFLVWQLLMSPAPRTLEAPAPSAVLDAPPLEPAPSETAPMPDKADTAPSRATAPIPERKSSTRAKRKRSRSSSRKKGATQQNTGKTQPQPPPDEPDPMDIDIRNPYRN
jgi:serine/threonine protein kinase